MFEETKGVIGSCKSRKDKQCNNQARKDKRKKKSLKHYAKVDTQQYEPYCKPRVKSCATEGQASHILNVIFMFYSNITISYKNHRPVGSH